MSEGEFGRSKGSQKGWGKWIQAYPDQLPKLKLSSAIERVRAEIDTIFLELMKEE